MAHRVPVISRIQTYVGINAEACRTSIAASASLNGSGGVVRSLHVQSFVYSLSCVDARAGTKPLFCASIQLETRALRLTLATRMWFVGYRGVRVWLGVGVPAGLEVQNGWSSFSPS